MGIGFRFSTAEGTARAINYPNSIRLAEKYIERTNFQKEYEKIKKKRLNQKALNVSKEEMKKNVTSAKNMLSVTIAVAVFIFFATFLLSSGLISSSGIPFYVVFPALVISIFAITFSAIRMSKWQRIAGEKIISPAVEKFFPGSKFYTDLKNRDERSESLEEYTENRKEELMLLPKLRSYGICDRDSTEYISNVLSTYQNGIPVMLFSLLCEHIESSGDNDTRTVVTYRGTQIIYKKKNKCEGITRIVTTSQTKLFKKEYSFLPASVPDLKEKIETGNIAFDTSHEVNTTNAIDAHTLLNPFVIEKLLNFRSDYGDYGITITPEAIYIAFEGTNRFINFPKNIEDFEEEGIRKMKNDVNRLFTAIEDLSYAISEHTKNVYEEKKNDIEFDF